MTSTPVPDPLPNTFEVTQGRRMAAAHDVGDHDEVERVRRHLVSEGSTDAADAAQFDDFTRAMILAKELVDASSVGNDKRAESLRRQMIDEFGEDTVAAVAKGMLFTAGQKQGWLPERDYDELVAFTEGAGPDVSGIIRQIRRGRPQ